MNNRDNISVDLAEYFIRARNLATEIKDLLAPVNTIDFLLAQLMDIDSLLSIYDEENVCENNFKVKVKTDFLTVYAGLHSHSKMFTEAYGCSYDKMKKMLDLAKNTMSDVYDEECIVTSATTSHFDDDLSDVINKSLQICEISGKCSVTTATLLHTIFSDENSRAVKFIQKYFKYDLKDLRKYLVESGAVIENTSSYSGVPSNISSFARCLNDTIALGEPCSILCRDKEIQAVWNILGKKTKKNAMLVGEAGVGKSAIVEAIVHSIINKNCPEKFYGFNVIEVSVNSMISGTKYRGEFEKKADDLIQYIESHDKLIVFIDEIHQIFGAGSCEESGVDLSGALKPLLARDKAIFIGATTVDDYQRSFSRDSAMKRRFQPVYVREPSIQEVPKMIMSKLEELMKFHKITVSSDVLKYTTIVAKAMNSNAKNPDLTLDVLDRAMTIAEMRGCKRLSKEHVKMVFAENYKMLNTMDEEEKKVVAWHEAGHFVAMLLSSHIVDQKLILASIFPTGDANGITLFEATDKIASYDDAYIEESVGRLLAGRISQGFIRKGYDAGAISDLEIATKWLTDRIMKYGMDEEFMNISLFAVCDDQNKLILTESDKQKIMSIAKRKVDEIYKKTEKLLLENKDIIELVAGELLKEGVVTASQIKEKLKK